MKVFSPQGLYSSIDVFAALLAVNKSAASAATPGYVKFQAVIKSAASAASLAEAALAADLITAI